VDSSLGEAILYIVAGLLVGLLIGWLVWGRKSAAHPGAVAESAPAAPAAVSDPVAEPVDEPEPFATSESATTAEPAAKPVAEPEPTAELEPFAAGEPAPEAEPTTAATAEPAATTVPITEPEPVTTAEPIAEPEPVAAATAPIAEPEPAAAIAEPTEPVEATAPIAEPEPVAAAEPVPAVTPTVESAIPADNLTRIEGIGPKIATALVAAGIRTYRQLADTDVDALRATLKSARLRFAPSLPTWPEQARLLADGDQSGFTALADQIVTNTEPPADPVVESALEPQPATPIVESVLEPSAPIPVQPPAAESNGATAPDDLVRIEGIGPKIAIALNAAGITTYEKLATSDVPALRAALSAAGMRFAPSLPTWPQQARLLADGTVKSLIDLDAPTETPDPVRS
jgi:predicted flap endonuclease-1-like 5' DNA nuclease